MAKRKTKRTKRGRGFTLIELLVVIAIIGLLSTMAVVALNNARLKSRDAKRVSDIKQIQTALELYFADVNTYPVGAAGDDSKELGVAATKTLSSGAGWAATPSGTTYMGLVPNNPTPNGSSYLYDSNAAGNDYGISFTLEGPTGGLAAGIQCAKPAGITAGDCAAI